MANVILFEDYPSVIEDVESALDEGGHVLVAKAETIQGAFRILRQLIDGVIETDFIIVDGNLRDETVKDDPALPGSRNLRPQFRYEHPGVTERIFLRDKPWKRKHALFVPKVTIFEPEQYRYQAHGRVIVDIVKQTGLTAKTIGFSLDPLDGVPLDLDDLAKNPWMLNRAIERLSL